MKIFMVPDQFATATHRKTRPKQECFELDITVPAKANAYVCYDLDGSEVLLETLRKTEEATLKVTNQRFPELPAFRITPVVLT